MMPQGFNGMTQGLASQDLAQGQVVPNNSLRVTGLFAKMDLTKSEPNIIMRLVGNPCFIEPVS